MAAAGSPATLPIALLALLLAPAGDSAGAQSERAEPRREEFLRRRADQRIRAGGRHLDLGMECRRQGLVSQAAAEILLAVEVSEGRNEAANLVLARMRSRDDRFWRRRRARPSRARIDAYAKKAEKIQRSSLEDQLELAAWAHRKGLALVGRPFVRCQRQLYPHIYDSDHQRWLRHRLHVAQRLKPQSSSDGDQPFIAYQRANHSVKAE